VRNLKDLLSKLKGRRRVWTMNVNRGGRNLELRVPG